MTRIPLNSTEREQGGFTDRFIVAKTDLTDAVAGEAQTLVLAVLPIGTLVGAVAVRLTTAFNSADAAYVSTALTVGDDGTANLFLTSQELNAQGTTVFNKAGTGTLKAYDAANNLKATFTPTAAKKLADLTSGQVTILARLVALDQLA